MIIKCFSNLNILFLFLINYQYSQNNLIRLTRYKIVTLAYNRRITRLTRKSKNLLQYFSTPLEGSIVV